MIELMTSLFSLTSRSQLRKHETSGEFFFCFLSFSYWSSQTGGGGNLMSADRGFVIDGIILRSALSPDSFLC